MASYHVHAINWNESRLLPVFFRHYASADKIYIHDNESDADVLKLIAAAGAESVPFSTGGTLDDTTHQRIKNTAWKISRGKADFVVVQDLDEFVHFPWAPGDIKAALELYKDLGITCAASQCYCVVCSDGEWDAVLSGQAPPWTFFRRGFRGDLFTGANYDKVQVFSPNDIRETNFNSGAHGWTPSGRIFAAFQAFRPLMLHCKHIGMNHEAGRRQAMARRISPTNKQRGLGFQYDLSDDVMRQKLHSIYTSDQVVDISGLLDRRNEYLLSQDWTSGLRETMDLLYKVPPKGPFRVLEVGCFEGRGTLLLLDKLCSHEDSVVYCVDPWGDVYTPERKGFEHLDKLFSGQYSRFLFNIRLARRKVRMFRGVSNAVLPALNELFDLVHIDGDHHPDQVYRDAVMALRVTRPNGLIIFDDYHWVQDGAAVRLGVDRFVSEFSSCITVVHSGAQLAVRVKGS